MSDRHGQHEYIMTDEALKSIHSFTHTIASLIHLALKMNYLEFCASLEDRSRCNYRLIHCTVPDRCVEADKSVKPFITTFPRRECEADTHTAHRVRQIHIPVSVQKPKMLLQSCQTEDVAFIKIQPKAGTTQWTHTVQRQITPQMWLWQNKGWQSCWAAQLCINLITSFAFELGWETQTELKKTKKKTSCIQMFLMATCKTR